MSITRSTRFRLAFVSLLAICLAASSSIASAARPSSHARAGQITITFWTHTHPPMIAEFKKIIKEYEHLHPNVHVAYQSIPNVDFATKMLSAFSTGTGPDVMNMDDNNLRSTYIPKGLLAPVNPSDVGYKSLAALKRGYVPGALEGASMNGKVYGLPTEFDVTALAINTKEFKKAGLNPNKPPKTWAQLDKMGEKIVRKHVAPRAFDMVYVHSGWYHNELGTLLLQTHGRVLAPNGKSAWINKPAAVKAVSIWYDMVRKYHIANPHLASNNATVPYQDFMDGSIAMTMFNPWGISTITPGSAAYGHYKVVPLPQVNPRKPVDPFYAYYMCVNAKSPHKAADFAFIRFALSKTGDWLKNVNFIQPKVGWNKLPQARHMPFYNVWAAELKHGSFIPVDPPQVDDLVMNGVSSTLLKGTNPKQAMASTAQEINSVVAP